MNLTNAKFFPVASDELRHAPIRILYVLDTLETGGAETSLLELVRRLDRDRFPTAVCSLYAGSTLRSDFEAADAVVYDLELKGKYSFACAVRRLLRVIRNFRPDIIHTTLFRAGQAGRIAGWLTRVPVISTFSGVPYEPERLRRDHGVRPWKLQVLRRLDALTAKLVTQFHCVSNSVRDSNCSMLNIPTDRARVISRGRDVEHFVPANDETRERIRRQLGISSNTHLLLNVGRLVSAKGHVILLDALPRILEALPNCRLLLVGDGALREELDHRIRAAGLQDTVTLAGWRGDVVDLLHAADLFVFPSLHEGLPGALIEAMLAGCPVVASNIPAHVDLIATGRTGLLCESDDPAALATAVVRMLNSNDLRRQFAAAARSHAVQTFDVRQTTSEFTAMYIDVARNHSRHQSQDL